MMTTQSSPIVTEMKVIPVAGQDSMLLNIGGAHNAWFTRNIVVLTDSAGNTGVGEAPGGEVIYQTLVDAIPQVVGQEVARLNKVVQRVHKGNQSADFDTFGKGAWTFELRVNAVAALEAALLDLLGKALNVPVCELLGPGKQRNAVTVLGYLCMTLAASALLRLAERRMDGESSYELVQADALTMTAGTYRRRTRPQDEGGALT